MVQIKEVQSLFTTAVTQEQPVLLLTPREHVAAVQELVDATDATPARMTRVWPMESFMENPIDYLDRLQTHR